MYKDIKKITIISLFQLILILILIPSLQAQNSNSITLEGYAYMNDIKIIPNQVSLILPDEMRFATIFNDGKYQIILSISEQVTGTFYIWYQNNWYDGGTITINENSDYYENNLYITTGSDISFVNSTIIRIIPRYENHQNESSARHWQDHCSTEY